MTPEQLLALCDAFLDADTPEECAAAEEAWDAGLRASSPEVIAATVALAILPR